MPDNYTYKSSGTNRQVRPSQPYPILIKILTPAQGNHYCARDYGSSAANSNSYHYSNSDGSYYYSNPNGSTYYNNGQGDSTYTSPSGNTYTSSSDSKK
ncbi:Hypothetical protein NCS54_00136300 [Fusarium falciforme]|uniref:Hypothetical protein n=1 Tax=Fusarium falciforme TaxID=195108 RepID=UPI002301D4EB|nr:Hypothetical protein NCS54_00136300 [Fusarium falciforme]WAO84157.1 Hypothetical protein NCS54_00136300 [Fusarium falciforme]